jgi:hypothetical protein
MLEFLFVLMVQAAAGAPAPQTSPPPPAASEQAVDAQPEASEAPQTDIRDIVRCRRVQTTGSRLGGRRCTSLRQDEEQRRNAREQTEKFQDMGRAQICQQPPCT